jgi:hypothetical protein
MVMVSAVHTGGRGFHSVTANQQNEEVRNNICFMLGAGVKRT